MKLTAITRSLSPKALARLTAQAQKPRLRSLYVDTRSFARARNACDLGERFHEAAANLLGTERLLPGARPFYPYLKAVRRYLRGLGYTRFEAEYPLVSGSVTGRADLVAYGRRGRAIVEFKTSGRPYAGDLATTVQAANYGYMLPCGRSDRRTALILCYIDLRSGRILFRSWADHRKACRPLRELRAA